MNEININSYEDFDIISKSMLDRTSKQHYIGFIGNYYEAESVFKNLIRNCRDAIIYFADITCDENEYENEYFVTIDDKNRISCDKLRMSNGQIKDITGYDHIYVSGDCSSNILKYCAKDERRITVCNIGSEDASLAEGFDGEQYEQVYHNNDGDATGFSQTWKDKFGTHSRSFYSTDSNLVERVLDKWGLR